MRAINHALTGALIGLTISEPVVALPLALGSHYVLDAIPHFSGMRVTNKSSEAVIKRWFRSRLFKQFLVADAALCFLLVLVLTITRPQHWLVACLCAFLAAAPDLISANRFFRVIRYQQWRGGWYFKFAHAIQWFERPIGAVVEVSWFAACLFMLWPFFR